VTCVEQRSGLGGAASGVGRQIGQFVKSGDKVACAAELANWKLQKDEAASLDDGADFIISAASSSSSSSSKASPISLTDADIAGLNSSVPFTTGGDKGTSALSTGERLSKTSPPFLVLGSVDELCSFVGLAHSMLMEKDKGGDKWDRQIGDIEGQLFEVMQRLFDVGGVVATRGGGGNKAVGDLPSCSSNSSGGEPQPPPPPPASPLMSFPQSNTTELESYITKQTSSFLPTLTNFILPTGSVLSSQLHVCRSVCRRVERDYIGYLEARRRDGNHEIEADTISIYLNRLSDFFFTAARVVNLVDKKRSEKKSSAATAGSGSNAAAAPSSANKNLVGRGDIMFVATGEGGLRRGVQYEDEFEDAASQSGGNDDDV
jgi:cob(I)alamin adenosyltransferase